MKQKATILTLLLLMGGLAGSAQTPLSYGFDHPQDTARTKVWWFFGETETTREGITADLEAFKQQGVGGVVYYDQVHGNGQGADKVFDQHWWQSLIFASQEAKRLGLSFEVNIGNGYVAGGKWITPDKSMQRVVMIESLVSPTPGSPTPCSPTPDPSRGGEGSKYLGNDGQTAKVITPLPSAGGVGGGASGGGALRGWHEDVAVLAVPYHEEILGDSKLLNIKAVGKEDSLLVFDFGKAFTARSITYGATPQGKARTSSMQVPPFAPRTEMRKGEGTQWGFFGCGFRELPSIGVLEVSDDGMIYNKVCDLRPKYQNLGGIRQQTVSFPTTRGRYFRVRLTTSEKVKLSDVVVSARARVDAWEEKASLVSEFIEADHTPIYNKEEMICADSMIDLTGKMAPDGTLTWPDAPAGQWLVMRFVAVSTGGHTKHGRAEALGLECDKLSVEGARLHWQCYTKPVIDSIRAHGGALEGICMDSHEAGPQNWTHDMPQQFKRLRGYDLKKFLPTIAGGMLVGLRSQLVLGDFRRTISDLITENYYGEFNRLCHDENLVLTAQAIGGALCMAGDAIEVKKLVDKPQGEFWGYQTEGNYDIKECSSAAHVYGKQIASGEAFTDITYKHSLADIKNLADYAYCFGINEFVVCAVAYQKSSNSFPNSPTEGREGALFLNTANGRQYVLNRLNTLWPLSRPFWDYQARCSWMLRQGRPVAPFCLYLGDDVPKRILSHLLPDIPQGYDFDAFTTDVLLNRLTVSNGRLVLPDGVSYSMMLLPADEQLTPAVRLKVNALVAAGAKVWDPNSGQSLADALSRAGLQPDVSAPANMRLYYCHRRIKDNSPQTDIYFLNNHSDEAVSGNFTFNASAQSAELWHPVTGQRTPLAATATADGRTAVSLAFAPRESYFVVLGSKQAQTNLNNFLGSQPKTVATIPVTGQWTVTFDPSVGGPSEPVTFGALNDWTQNSDPRIKYYSGTAAYTNTFVLDKKDRQAHYSLVIGQPGSVAQVFVNGKEAGTVWCSPWQVDITPYIKKGRNQLEIRVANTLWNRLVGDANRPEAERIMQQTTPLAKPADKLVPSGIVGPVVIICNK